MAANPIEVRLAHLEGAYEQVDKRLGTIEVRLGDIDRKIDAVFFRLVMLTLGTWVTYMLSVFLVRR